MNKYTMGGGG